MKGKAVFTALSKYLTSLVMTLIAPLQWMRLMKVAGQHQALDPKARQKIAIAIIAGLGFAGAGVFIVADFQDDATQGIYETLSGRLSSSLGNEAYNAALTSQGAAVGLIATADRKIDEAQQANDAEAEETWQNNRAAYVESYNQASEDVIQFTANHNLWLIVNDILLVDRDDDVAKALIETRGSIDYDNLDASSTAAFARKDAAVQDMGTMLAWFVYPGIIGALWAPMAFAIGSILRTTFVPSDSVGFKPYPGAAAGLFLLFGAFGVPALFFAAWVNQDFVDRTETGQISL
jgi:hypothetical protein